MAESVSYSSNYMVYWDNSPYIYPTSDNPQLNNVFTMNTGWHVLPTMLWKHFLSPKQWWEFHINYEAYHVAGYTATLYNPIPITQNLAIQGTSTFNAFNNTIYSLGAQDILYETSYHNWWTDPVWKYFYTAYKEGAVRTGNTGSEKWQRLVLPKYLWENSATDPVDVYTWSWDPTPPIYASAAAVWPHTNQGEQHADYSGCFWDPLTDPDSILELRPGKNSMTFNWATHGCDESIWYNLDQLVRFLPYVPEGPWAGVTTTSGNVSRYGKDGTYIPNPKMTDPFPQTSYTTGGVDQAAQRPQPQYGGRYQDFSMPNYLNLPIVPVTWFWKEMQQNLIEDRNTQKPQLGWPGTEFQAYKYPPTQSYVKGIPLYDENNTLIATSTQGILRCTLHLKAKKRRSRYYCPTWGPLSGAMAYTIQGTYTPAMVRYRTGGARRGWANHTADQPRTDTPTRWGPYTTQTYTSTTVTTYTTSTASMAKPKIKQ